MVLAALREHTMSWSLTTFVSRRACRHALTVSADRATASCHTLRSRMLAAMAQSWAQSCRRAPPNDCGQWYSGASATTGRRKTLRDGPRGLKPIGKNRPPCPGRPPCDIFHKPPRPPQTPPLSTITPALGILPTITYGHLNHTPPRRDQGHPPSRDRSR